MDKDVTPSNHNEDELPPELGQHAEGDADRAQYAALWRLLRQADTATDAAYTPDDAWDELAARLASDAAAEPPASAAAQTSRSPQTPNQAPDRAPDRSARTASSGRVVPAWVRQGAAAAGVVLALVLGVVIWWSQPVAVQTAVGEQTAIMLPDGSTAQLHGATTLTYDRGFAFLPWIESSPRQVTLQGEAFFSVVRAPRTFRVTTPNATVEVLGTTFTVRTRPRTTTDAAPVTDVILSSGRVQLRAAPGDTTLDAAARVLLTEAGQRSRVEGDALAPTPPETLNLKYASAWRQGGFAVRRAPLPVVLRELEIQFGTSVRLRAPEVKTDTMTLHYARNARLEEVLQDIAAIQGLRYRSTSDGYELIPR